MPGAPTEAPVAEEFMAKIDIDHRHGLDMEKAREKLRELAAKLEQKYKLAFTWSGDDVAIKGMGVKGQLRLTQGRLAGALDVPFILKNKVKKALDDRIEQEFPA